MPLNDSRPEGQEGKRCRVLAYDLETSPSVTYTWGLFNQNIGINQVVEPSRVICFAARWMDEPDCVFYSEFRDGHDVMIRKLHELFSEADALCGYNSRSFDDLHAAREFALLGLPPVTPEFSIDLYRVVKRKFKFLSGKLDWVAVQFGLPGKEHHGNFPGFELWKECLAGNPDAWAEMETYNRQDVNLLIDLYEVLLPWIPASMLPNVALIKQDYGACPSCGSHRLNRNGTRTTRTGRYQRFICQECGRYSIQPLRVATSELRGI